MSWMCKILGHNYITVIKTSLGLTEGFYTTKINSVICKRCGSKVEV